MLAHLAFANALSINFDFKSPVRFCLKLGVNYISSLDLQANAAIEVSHLTPRFASSIFRLN